MKDYSCQAPHTIVRIMDETYYIEDYTIGATTQWRVYSHDIVAGPKIPEHALCEVEWTRTEDYGDGEHSYLYGKVLRIIDETNRLQLRIR